MLLILSFAGKLWVVMVVLGLSTFVFVRARESASALEGWELENQQEGNLRVGRLDSSLLNDVKAISEEQDEVYQDIP